MSNSKFASNSAPDLNRSPLWQHGEWSYELFDRTRDANQPRCRELIEFFAKVWGKEPRQQVLCGFFDHLGPASVHAYEFVDLRSQSPSSPQLYPLPFLRDLSALGLTRVMCMEALAVREDRRKTSSSSHGQVVDPVPLAAWTIDMGLCFASHESPHPALSAVIACTRDSRSVHQLASSLGYRSTPYRTQVQGEASSLMYWPVPRRHPREPQIPELLQGASWPMKWPVSISSLWKSEDRAA